jgi:hypothetical protein
MITFEELKVGDILFYNDYSYGKLIQLIISTSSSYYYFSKIINVIPGTYWSNHSLNREIRFKFVSEITRKLDNYNINISNILYGNIK